MRLALVTLVALSSLVLPPSARAHLHLVDPPSRSGGEVLKDGPCGQAGSVRGTNVTTYEAGQTIEIRIDEYIDHPGHYRVAFDVDGDDDFEDPVCLENCTTNGPTAPVFAPGDPAIVLADFVADDAAREQTLTVTLPDVVCDRCTLQVIQVMYDKRPYTIGGNDNYYQCADLVLVPRAGTEDAGVAVDGGAVTDAGQTDAGVTDAGTRRDAAVGDAGHTHEPTGATGGCSCRSAEGADASLGLFALGFFLARRRRRASRPHV